MNLPSPLLILGDNLKVMRDWLPDGSVDLVYLDPPFNSGRKYKLLRGAPAPHAYNDTWTWNERRCRQLAALTSHPHDPVAKTLAALAAILGPGSTLAHLTMITPRLLEVRRILKTTGSVYLHCDSRLAAPLKLLADAVFGAENFLNHIVWCYGLGGSSRRRWPRKHDDLLFYAKSAGEHYFLADTVPAESHRMKGQLKKAPDWWTIPSLNNLARERVGYPTQKPQKLLERIVSSSCPPDGVVLDPFCGSGTTLAAAANLGRNWVGIDSSPVAVALAAQRLHVLPLRPNSQRRLEPVKVPTASALGSTVPPSLVSIPSPRG